eukprot:jgi/Ulvmu1/2228/UM013_0075.1
MMPCSNPLLLHIRPMTDVQIATHFWALYCNSDFQAMRRDLSTYVPRSASLNIPVVIITSTGTDMLARSATLNWQWISSKEMQSLACKRFGGYTHDTTRLLARSRDVLPSRYTHSRRRWCPVTLSESDATGKVHSRIEKAPDQDPDHEPATATDAAAEEVTVESSLPPAASGMAEAESPEVPRAAAGMQHAVEVTAVTAHSTQHVTQQQLHVLWAADSVPYAAAVLDSVLEELGSVQVQSLHVFASGATAASLCDPRSAADRPAGGVLVVDIAASPQAGTPVATARMTAHAVQLAQEDQSAAYVVVSSDASATPVLSTLRALGRTTLAVTAAPSSVTAPLRPPGTAWLHLHLNSSSSSGSSSVLPSLAAAASPQPERDIPALNVAPSSVPRTPTAAQIPTAEQDTAGPNLAAATGQPASQPPSESDTEPQPASAPVRDGSSVDTAAPRGGAAPSYMSVVNDEFRSEVERLDRVLRSDPEDKAHSGWVEMLPVDVQYKLLASCLKRMSGVVFSRLKARMMLQPEGFCDSPDFPSELWQIGAFKDALVTGLMFGAGDNAWAAHQKVAVLTMLHKFDDGDMHGQLGVLLKDSQAPAFSNSVKSRKAVAAAADTYSVSLGRMVLMQALAQAVNAGHGDPDPASWPGSETAEAYSFLDPLLCDDRPDTEWLLLASVLRRLSIQWFDIFSQDPDFRPYLWEGGPYDDNLRSRSQQRQRSLPEFRQALCETFASAAVPVSHKRKLLNVLLGQEPVDALCAKIGDLCLEPNNPSPLLGIDDLESIDSCEPDSHSMEIGTCIMNQILLSVT